MSTFKPTLLNNYPESLLIGKDIDGHKIYLSKPTWDCNWYWGFGYIGNKNLHTHLNQLHPNKNISLKTAITAYFSEFVLTSENDIWSFCEIVESIYCLLKTAALYTRGGSNYTNNPCRELLRNDAEYTRINTELVPELIDQMYNILLQKVD